MRDLWETLAGLVMGGAVALPLWMVRALVAAGLITLAVWALRMPKEYAFLGSPNQKWYRDVRLWAAAVIFCELIPYIFF